ncbi:MAG: TetR family transcriptional regulator [Bdellovibrio sp. CG12_big_fil_rev_8_21_14_0_65_39_13]|nr:MAG: TetR family transcriptional regulator [Bdellovibrio sp. CG22_combo_CG10-13_8_21_14_all_39_27]PIQ61750.1 MAG: TetR family transcriptional regulator [Bdellovibrio sp. CG12_big_fil_rev_8_21_14_0_65_39_13]PIR34898.1 MAG: TetR family transcriptional regulator [Bdellovibrio sp. CG11_big_fil_rev_8_21_14_0_20_39_38]
MVQYDKILILMGRTKCFNREEVLDRAIQVFWRQGFANTSLHDLEQATGVNKSGLYSEFKDKEDLFCQSIKRYKETNLVAEILTKQPLGYENVENFLKSSLNCSGEKGCYLANTMRELSFLPHQVKKLILENVASVAELLLMNLKAVSNRNDLDQFVSMILTFSTGISLKLNAMKPKEVEPEIDFFSKNFKKLILDEE